MISSPLKAAALTSVFQGCTFSHQPIRSIALLETVTFSSSVLHSDQTLSAGFIYERFPRFPVLPFRKTLAPPPSLLKEKRKKILHNFPWSLYIRVALFSADRKIALVTPYNFLKTLKRQMCWNFTANMDYTMCKKNENVSCSQIREDFKDDF